MTLEFALLLLYVFLSWWGHWHGEPQWNGLTLALEDRCSPYDRGDYRYPQSVEAEVIAERGLYSPYTDTWFDNPRETDIEHIVALSEAHDSGLCAADAETRRVFARDVLNLTLASPSLNRHQKGARDAAEWLPAVNQCWYADRVVSVKRKYDLSVDYAEAEALSSVLRTCTEG